MKKLLVFLAIVISTQVVSAQLNEKEASPNRKEKRKARLEKEHQLTRDMLTNRDFVLEAHTLQNRYGRRVPVSPGINFVSVDSMEAIIQIGSNHGIGANGVGGVTARGRITEWKLNENKKNKTFDLKMNIMSPIGIYDVFLSISPSGKAQARITGLRAGNLTFDGNMVPWSESTVHIGTSL